ncbi:right-handed parallel beta-helix repeat-containing protein [Phytohabitans suffuscus]|uniref:right-handed parallel beta-helix repeat-containing protein n=1 Tax=Phytohabitans suffuscus TaxID=624315 RepID=UPI001E589052|nr:right-handed parallel beta-helix repeat-containing protein [Phytohabitans suffuscus]
MLICGAVLGVAGPARAADETILYVQRTSATCTDSGPGTTAQPFCTIGAAAAAVSAGQTVVIGAGNYPERIAVAKSGTPDQPITFRSVSAGALPMIVGPTAGFVIDGQHDIKILNVRIDGTEAVPAIDIRASSGITVQAGSIQMASWATAPAIRLASVTRSWMGPFVRRAPVGGITLDANTTGVEVRSGLFSTPVDGYMRSDSAGIRVTAPGNTVVDNIVSAFGEAAIALEPDAAGTLVVNNSIGGGPGFGIRNRGATGTAITNNTVLDRCRDGIRVEGRPPASPCKTTGSSSTATSASPTALAGRRTAWRSASTAVRSVTRWSTTTTCTTSTRTRPRFMRGTGYGWVWPRSARRPARPRTTGRAKASGMSSTRRTRPLPDTRRPLATAPPASTIPAYRTPAPDR